MLFTVTGCELPNYGVNCSQVCECGAGVDRCDSVSGCVCLSGWTGKSCDVDIDECQENPNICGIKMVCVNKEGSYRCDCGKGLQRVENSCEGNLFSYLVFSDIGHKNITKITLLTDYISKPISIMSQLIIYCNNELNFGGGISLHVIIFLHLICKDIDECADESLNDCPPETTHCVNSFGNYSCECRPGFQGQGSDCKGNKLNSVF